MTADATQMAGEAFGDAKEDRATAAGRVAELRAELVDCRESLALVLAEDVATLATVRARFEALRSDLTWAEECLAAAELHVDHLAELYPEAVSPAERAAREGSNVFDLMRVQDRRLRGLDDVEPLITVQAFASCRAGGERHLRGEEFEARLSEAVVLAGQSLAFPVPIGQKPDGWPSGTPTRPPT